MKITLLVIGKTVAAHAGQGIYHYTARLRHYSDFTLECLPDAKNTRNLSKDTQKHAEGQALLARLDRSDYVVLLDEHGTEMTSTEFSGFLQKRMASGLKRLVFVVGGPYGFSPEVYTRADSKISLSRMTFPHDLVRLIFVEQLYRAFTILNHEPYHHE